MAVVSAIIGAISYAGAFVGGFIGGALGLQTAAILQLGAIGSQVALFGASTLLSRALQPNISVSRQEIQAIINETDAARRVFVGENLVGGIRALFDVRNGELFQLVAVAHGHVHGFGAFHIDGEKVTLDSRGVVSSGHASGSIGTGTIAHGFGGDYPILRSKFNYWTKDHRLENVATFLVSMTAPAPEEFSKKFPRGSNTTIQVELKGQTLFDPRDGGRRYSDNAALVMLHYLMHADGFNLGLFDIDMNSWAAMADVCDRPIPKKGGGTAPNLRLWGYWSLDEDPRAVIDRMHGSCGIRPYEMQNGRIGAIGGNFGQPAMTLTTKDIESIKTFSRSQERSGYNILQPFFMSKKHKFSMYELDSWRDEERIAEEGKTPQEYRLEMCPDASQCRRLAKEQIANDNREKLEVVTNLVGLKARYPRVAGQRHTILLDYQPDDDPEGAIQGEYEVGEHEIDPMNMRCRIVLFKAVRESELWTPEEEGGTTIDLVEFGDDPAPEIEAVLSLYAVNSTTYIAIDVTKIPNRPDLSVQAEYRETSSESWIPVSGNGFSLKTPAIKSGEYQVRVRFNGVFTGIDEWEVYNFAFNVEPTVPDAPTELIPSNSGGAVHLSWRNPQSDMTGALVYRSLGTVFDDADQIAITGGVSGQISEYRDDAAVSGTTYSYWVTAFNGSKEGPPSSRAEITAA